MSDEPKKLDPLANLTPAQREVVERMREAAARTKQRIAESEKSTP